MNLLWDLSKKGHNNSLPRLRTWSPPTLPTRLHLFFRCRWASGQHHKSQKTTKGSCQMSTCLFPSEKMRLKRKAPEQKNYRICAGETCKINFSRKGEIANAAKCLWLLVFVWHKLTSCSGSSSNSQTAKGKDIHERQPQKIVHFWQGLDSILNTTYQNHLNFIVGKCFPY